MSSIPLPALGLRQPEQPDMFGNLAKALSVKNLIQENQAGGIQLQQQQQALKDQQAGTAALHEWDGQDPEQLTKLMAKNGASINAVLATKQHFLDTKAKYSAIAKDDAETGAKNLETMKGKNDMMVGALNTVMGAKDEELVPALQSTAADLVQRGLLDPQHAQQVSQMAGLPPDQIRQKLKLFEKSYRSDTQQLEDAAKEAVTAKDMAETKKLNTEASYGGAPQMQEARYRSILADVTAKKPVTADDLNFVKGYEASEKKTTAAVDAYGNATSSTSTPQGLATAQRAANVNPSASGAAPSGGNPYVGMGSTRMADSPAFRAGVPANLAPTIDLIGQYRLNPQALQRAMAKGPAVTNALEKAYPDFDATEYAAKNKAMQSFLAGKQADQIRATNIALSHAGVLSDAIDGLQNNDVKVLNKIAQKFGLETGDSPASTFRLIVHKLAPELAQAYIAGGGGEGERGQIQTDYDPALGSKILHNNLAATVNLLRPNIDALANQYKQAIGRDDFQQRFIGKEAQGALAKFAGNPNGQPAGAAQHAPGKAAGLPEGQTGTGSDGKKYVVKGGKWVAQ